MSRIPALRYHGDRDPRRMQEPPPEGSIWWPIINVLGVLLLLGALFLFGVALAYLRGR